ncbi:hypothetical protein LNO81_07515 [Klebsiella variicola subsp. variicola]|nr:hypothetical protein [Klebsiella variicola subsp. variicola]
MVVHWQPASAGLRSYRRRRSGRDGRP